MRRVDPALVGAGRLVIYTSQNLQGHEIFAECNPGGGSRSACSQDDVHLQALDGYGQVTSNHRRTNTYVNAIGYRKFVETLPQGGHIAPGAYRYQGQVSLPLCPSRQPEQAENPQAVHFMIMLWDGRDALYPAGQRTLEGVIYWQLNPWKQDYGHIKLYTGEPAHLIDTGIVLLPESSGPACTAWHTFELEVDFGRQEYVAVAIDGLRRDLWGVGLARVYHPDWGQDISLSITTESVSAWPEYDCAYVFAWTTRFRDLALSHLP